MCLITSFVIKFYSAKVIGRIFSFFVCGSGSGSRGKEAEAEAVGGLAASTSLACTPLRDRLITAAPS